MVSSLFLIIGCAHSITITPPLHTVDVDGVTKVEKNVGYFISQENLKKRVITSAGGGDKVKYFPYKESEPILKKVLSNRYKNVYAIPALDDGQFIATNYISYIFIPKIDTESSSRSSWVWPPTDFTMSIDCKVLDPSGQEIWQTSVQGEAHIGIPDATRVHGLAGGKATKDAFSKLLKEIVDAEMLQ